MGSLLWLGCFTSKRPFSLLHGESVCDSHLPFCVMTEKNDKLYKNQALHGTDTAENIVKDLFFYKTRNMDKRLLTLEIWKADQGTQNAYLSRGKMSANGKWVQNSQCSVLKAKKLMAVSVFPQKWEWRIEWVERCLALSYPHHFTLPLLTLTSAQKSILRRLNLTIPAWGVMTQSWEGRSMGNEAWWAEPYRAWQSWEI